MSSKAHDFATAALRLRAQRDVHHEHTREVIKDLATEAEARILGRIEALEDELHRMQAYVSGQTLADIAYQASVALQEAEKSGDRAAVGRSEAYAAGLFGADWRRKIEALISQGQKLDAAMLRTVA